MAQADQPVAVAGLSQQAAVTAFRGDASWTGYAMVSGRWYTGPGQVDVASRFLTATGTAVGDTITLTLNGRQIPVRIVGQVFDTRNSGLTVVTDWQTLAGADPGLAPNRYDIAVRPGTALMAYVQALRNRLGPGYLVQVNNRSSDAADLMISLIGALTVLLAVVAGLGVLNTVVLHTRERVHDLGVFKAVGMTPRQTIAMVVCWVAGVGLVAGVIAVPAGIALHRYVLPAMAAAAGVGLPPSFLNVYHGWELAALALAGVAIAVAGALLPAGWAAAHAHRLSAAHRVRHSPGPTPGRGGLRRRRARPLGRRAAHGGRIRRPGRPAPPLGGPRGQGLCPRAPGRPGLSAEATRRVMTPPSRPGSRVPARRPGRRAAGPARSGPGRPAAPVRAAGRRR